MSTAPYQTPGTQVLFGTESTQGTAATVDTRYRLEQGMTPPDPENDWIIQRPIGDGRTVESKEPGQIQFQGGSLPITLTDADTEPLEWLFGSSSTTDNTTTYTPLAGDDPSNIDIPPSFTMEVAYYGGGSTSDFVREFTGCTVDSGSLTIDNEDRLILELDSVWALDGENIASATADPGVVGGDKWLFSDTSSDLSLFGTSFARVLDFNLSLSNGAEEGRYLNSSTDREAFEILWQNAEISLEATVRPTDSDLWDDLLAGNQGAASFELTNTAGSVMDISCTDIGLESAPHEVPEEGAVEVDLSTQADDVSVDVTT